MNSTSEEIILAYLKLSATMGKASIGDIATSVGIRKSSIYSHFEDFTDLKRKALSYCQEKINEKKFEVNFKASGAEDVIADLLNDFAKLFIEEPLCWYFTIVNQNRLSDPDFQILYNKISMMLNARVQVALELCIQKGWLNISDTDYAAMFLCSALKEKLPVLNEDWEFNEIPNRFVRLFS